MMMAMPKSHTQLNADLYTSHLVHTFRHASLVRAARAAMFSPARPTSAALMNGRVRLAH